MIYNGKIKRKNDQRPQRSVVDILGLLVYWLIVAPITFIASGTWSTLKWLVRNSWAATKWTARNGWAAIVWIAKVSWYGTVWAIGGSWKTFVVAPLRWLRILIFGREPEFANAQQAERYRLTRRSFRRKQFFLAHVFLFIGWMVILTYSMYEASVYSYGGGYMWRNPILATFIWIVILLFHFMRLRIGQAEDEALLQVMGETGEKRKFHYEEEYVQQRPDMTEEYRMRLGDDGELVHGDLTEEEIAFYEQQERNQQG
ncbi:MAG: hypothetical protein H6670_14915 [Anaerolineaceae bacterium]|nr:hypothetical protein [Anaerolineaceae bacterium]